MQVIQPLIQDGQNPDAGLGLRVSPTYVALMNVEHILLRS